MNVFTVKALKENRVTVEELLLLEMNGGNRTMQFYLYCVGLWKEGPWRPEKGHKQGFWNYKQWQPSNKKNNNEPFINFDIDGAIVAIDNDHSLTVLMSSKLLCCLPLINLDRKTIKVWHTVCV